MINVKLIVLIVCVDITFGNPYCEICSHHILCKYHMPGPGESCRSYDKAALLTRNDIEGILTKLNERRNYVAMGYSKVLPKAGNMRKIVWSEELALFAQRWADQCDQFLWPDNEDECRNLKDKAAGQNIASVAAATSTLNVKSLVDTWFMQIFDYSGSVSYYNQSSDSKNKYFTQMIWAETKLVGCGRARFYIQHKNFVVERLVCNFAPRGNIHGRPVYAIGFPATQCPEDARPDLDFKGLCSQHIETHVNYSTHTNVKMSRSTSSSSKVSSLLRILNLSNNSAKHAIDPIRSNFKQLKPNVRISVDQRNKKIRHIENNTNVFIEARRKYANPMQITIFKSNQNPITSVTPNQKEFHVQERGHSRVYHDHHVHKNKHTASIRTTEDSYRRFVVVTKPYEEESFRNNNLKNQCTRTSTEEIHYTSNAQNQCTRQKNYCAPTTCQDHTLYQQEIYSRKLCPCSIPISSPTQMTICSTPAPTSSKFICSSNCQCSNINYSTNRYQRSSPFFDYYDQIPYIGAQNGARGILNKKVNKENLSLNKNNENIKKSESFHFRHLKQPSTIYGRKYNFHEHVKDDVNIKINEDYTKNTHKNLNLYRKNKRDTKLELIYKPFWQMDEVSPKTSIELKSLRFTTLSNKRKEMKYRKPIYTEPITFKLSGNNHGNRKAIATEKYLSFEELMRLRKLGESEIIDVYEARRTAKTTAKATAKTTSKTIAKTTAKTTAKTAAKASVTPKAATTTKTTVMKLSAATTAAKATTKTLKEMTTNTPFERKKYCTRKLTCTWTAITMSQTVVGSLTPPGYVEGCTRTFTCTRIYLDRNKFSTLNYTNTDVFEHEDETAPYGDEDYCEKRALDVHRRESGNEYFNDHFTSNTLSQLSSQILIHNNEASTEKMHHMYLHDFNAQNDCKCDEESLRVKRDEIGYNDQSNERETLSYGDLYYRVLQKIISGWRNHHPTDKQKCACSNGIRNVDNTFLKIFLFYFMFGNLTHILFI